MKGNLVKRKEASELVLNVMVSGLLTVLLLRLYFKITNYPQISFGVWHIAHLTWGGLFLLVGLFLALVFYSKRSLKWASVIGGVGWGLFIDEVGKFVTRDNDYWFKPAIIFIYISFVILFLIYRKLEKSQKTDVKTQWYELMEGMEEVVDNELELNEKRELLRIIDKIKIQEKDGKKLELLHSLEKVVNSTKVKEDRKSFDLIKTSAKILKVSYTKLFRKKLVFYGLITYSLWFIGDKFIDTFTILTNPHRMAMVEYYYSKYDFFSKTDVYMISMKIIVDLVVAGFYLTGLVWWINKKTLRGIKFYQIGLLISIFLSSVFKFYFEQFSGVIGFIVSLLIWNWLNDYRLERIKNIK